MIHNIKNKSIEEQGGLYQVAIRKGLEFGLRISIHKFSRLEAFKSERTAKLIEVFI